jgi:hypothetical protein
MEMRKAVSNLVVESSPENLFELTLSMPGDNLLLVISTIYGPKLRPLIVRSVVMC